MSPDPNVTASEERRTNLSGLTSPPRLSFFEPALRPCQGLALSHPSLTHSMVQCSSFQLAEGGLRFGKTIERSSNTKNGRHQMVPAAPVCGVLAWVRRGIGTPSDGKRSFGNAGSRPDKRPKATSPAYKLLGISNPVIDLLRQRLIFTKHGQVLGILAEQAECCHRWRQRRAHHSRVLVVAC